ncbi:sigma-54-dependent Fis family transcriptional regulator [Microvenator marinus]|uniref:Sigma-54-dependent Fis family transcriptional regulator n=2 Tax=Microvenator marinus TaxID=2600177 RepID=A0A5B8XRR3_9DELT|nr:sigma-54-dependent Fis family transcriptional regulator [Microvenator marinus]
MHKYWPLSSKERNLCSRESMGDTLESSWDYDSIDDFLNDLSGAVINESGIDVISVDPAMQRVIRLLDSVAGTPATVLLSGESGVGKEVFARYIHERSQVSNGPFIAINCAAIPESLLESELFGHEKGAFSGAVRTHQGVFERAHKGTLLLDEISEMPIELQAKLLRVIQERQITRVGGSKPIDIDIRIVATTNREMDDWVNKGGFRRDLFYRISVFPVTIPPLRDRRGDILPLANFYARHFAEAYGQRVIGYSKQAMKKLRRHTYPGNVRELVNIVQRALILAPHNGTIEEEHIVFQDTAETIDAIKSFAHDTLEIQKDQLAFKVGEQSLTEVRRDMILATLRHFDGNRSKAAEVLGVSTRTIRNKLAQYRALGVDLAGIDEEE